MKIDRDRIGCAVLILCLIVIAFVSSGCAHEDPWTKRDTALQLTVTGLMVADAISTSRIKDNPNAIEGGAIARQLLGPQPAGRDVAIYFGTLTISHFVIARALPARWRPWFQGFAIVDHGRAVRNNCDAGLCR